MKEVRVDLHVHSTCSDGSWAPARLFQELRNRKIDYFCISDHDTMGAYPVPEDLRTRCIPGIEIDSEHAGNTVHILGYGVLQDGELLRRLDEQRGNRERRALRILERLNELGICLTLDQVRAASAQTKSVGRPHIGRALVSQKYCGDLQEAFDKYLAEGCGAYVPLERLSTSEAIDLVHQSHGVAVLAHPRRLHQGSDIESLCGLGLDGIEVVHPSADQGYQAELLNCVDKLGLIATAGTDFHGRSTDGPIGIPFAQSRIDQLLDAISKDFDLIR